MRSRYRRLLPSQSFALASHASYKAPQGNVVFCIAVQISSAYKYPLINIPATLFQRLESLSQATIGPSAWCIIVLRHHNNLSVTPLQLPCRIIHNHGLYSSLRQRCIPGHQYTCPLDRTRLQDSSYSPWRYLSICFRCGCSWLLCAQMFSQPAAEADSGETTGIGPAWRVDASLFCPNTSITIIRKPIRLHPGSGQL